MSRSGNILWSNEPTKKDIYYQNQFLFSMPARNIVGSKYDKYIEVGRYSMKYDVTTVEEVYKMDGTKLDKKEITKLKENEELEKSKKNASIQSFSIKDTFWEIRANKLYYKNEVIFVAAINIDQLAYLHVSKFHFGFALLYIIWDVDPELGVSSEKIGYIDINGICYWKN